jgi:hypothetical protein
LLAQKPLPAPSRWEGIAQARAFKRINLNTQIMESPEIVKQTWQQLVERLTTRFTAEGYQVVHFQHDDMVFGSCFIIWSNNEDALRLTWDGKECWFVLEETLLPILTQNLWQEIIVAPFDPDEHDEMYAQIMIRDVLASLD